MAAPSYDIEISRVLDASRDRVYEAITDPDQFVRWYGPDGFSVARETVELDPRVGGRHRFTMVGEADPRFRSTFDGRFTEVVPGTLLVSSGAWDGIPGQDAPWEAGLSVELLDEGDKTRIVVREGPHPPETSEMGRLAWEMMFAKLEVLVSA